MLSVCERRVCKRLLAWSTMGMSPLKRGSLPGAGSFPLAGPRMTPQEVVHLVQRSCRFHVLSWMLATRCGDPRDGRQHQLMCVTRSMSRLCRDGCESDWTVLMCLLSDSLPACLCACVRVWSLRRTPATVARASFKQALKTELDGHVIWAEPRRVPE